MKTVKGNMWAIGGGKGGVGKSFIVSNLACSLALRGHTVIVVDADLTGANIHTLFGIPYPDRTLNIFLRKKVDNLSDVLLPTSLENVHLICGASKFLAIANPKYAQKQKLIRGIASLDADYILIDIGAGASLDNLDFFNLADLGIVVTSPSPTAIQNGYTFLKMTVHRKLLNLFPTGSFLKEEVASALRGDGRTTNMNQVLQLIKEIDDDAKEKATEALRENRYKLVVNMATQREGERVSRAMAAAAYQFLRVKLSYLGRIDYDRNVESSIRQMKPILLSGASSISTALTKMVNTILSETDQPEMMAPDYGCHGEPAPISNKNPEAPMSQLSCNNEILYSGKKLHVQTEDLGREKGQILSIVYYGGEVLFSKKTDYGELLNEDDVREAVMERVKKQHHTVIAGIMKGKLKDKIPA